MQESFKNRVTKFWNSFASEEYLIREMMDNKAKGETLLSFVDNILQTAFHKVYFEMGIDKNGKYELILTPEGDRAMLIQLHYWLQNAPESLLEKWNFYSSKPGKANPSSSLNIYDINLSEDDIKLYPEVNAEGKKINIQVYAPKLMELDENKRYSAFFIYLDQFISEIYTMEYIGYIDFLEEDWDEDAQKISEIKDIIDRAIEENNWPEIENPCEIYSGYKMEPAKKQDWILREDVVTGYTSCIPAINAYYSKNSEQLKEMQKDGVVFGFLFFENSDIPKENIVGFRAEIEDKIIDEVALNGIAACIGGATGFHFSYIDFVIYDLDAFLPIAKEVLDSYKFEEYGFASFIREEKPVLWK